MTAEERAYNYASKKNPTKFTVGEIAKHYNDGYQDAISKACEWLENWNAYRVCVEGQKDWFIKQFKKAMEE